MTRHFLSEDVAHGSLNGLTLEMEFAHDSASPESADFWFTTTTRLQTSRPAGDNPDVDSTASINIYSPDIESQLMMEHPHS